MSNTYLITYSLSLTENSSCLHRTPALLILPHVAVIPARKQQPSGFIDFPPLIGYFAFAYLLRRAQSAWFPSEESGGAAQNSSSANSASCTWLIGLSEISKIV